MNKFKFGQKVRLKSEPNDVFTITNIIEHRYIIIKATSSPPGYYKCIVNDSDIYSAEISMCPVCYQDVECENDKIKEHKNHNELCYGSYTPTESK